MTPKTNTTPIWNLRNEIVDARIEAAGISDVLTRYNETFDLREQIDLLAELAEAIECGADVAYFDPRTVVEMEADEQDAQHYADMLTASNP
jgi:ADP-dependent phosphofructokinase/glucokinase